MLKGYFKGIKWNDKSRTYEFLKLGEKDNGAIVCGYNVSGKDKEGNREYGKPIDTKIIIKSASEGERVWNLLNGSEMIEAYGMYVPNNWTNKEGKEIKGNMFLVYDSTMFKAVGNAPSPSAPADDSDEEMPW